MYCLTLTAVGDDVSKKTELFAKYTGRGNQRVNVLEEVIVDYRKYLVNFIDTESSDDYFYLRRSEIKKADCVIMFYSVKYRNSFENLWSKWCLEVRECIDVNVPLILVGTEIEKRNNSNENCVSTEEGQSLKKLIGAYSFVECSIEDFIGVDDVFIEAIRSVISRYCVLKRLIKIK